MVSIRAPRAGRDGRRRLHCRAQRRVSIRAPRAGRDTRWQGDRDRFTGFLSARPGRGATDDRIAELVDEYVSIRAPRAGRDPQYVTFLAGHIIVSIRAPRAGRDEKESDGDLEVETCFYPRAPGGARHCQSIPICLIKTFLSARPGRGATGTEGQDDVWYVVSIRAPRAGRDLASSQRVVLLSPFLSARPGRGATCLYDSFLLPAYSFYPRAPGGARPAPC